MTTTSENLLAYISSPISGVVLSFGPWLTDMGQKCIAAILVSMVTFVAHKLIASAWSKVKK